MANSGLNVTNYDGVSGVISMNQDHSTLRPTNFKIVKGGIFIPLN
ncbi:MAG: hypothetical protein WCI04_02660 [archaeon]